MPAKIWEEDDNGLYSRVTTGWDTAWTAEEHRSDAEELDTQLDGVLDAALAKVESVGGAGAPEQFVRAWAIGRALEESRVLQSPALANEPRELLWRALARKCRTGARSSGERELRWWHLRPKSAGEPRREGGRLDYFEMCRWLAEQNFGDAVGTFGAHIRNVWQMMERPALRPLILREAILAWLTTFPLQHRERLTGPKEFAESMKVLRGRWPARGPGSAKRPIHYSKTELGAEVRRLLSPLAVELEGSADPLGPASR